MVLCSALCFIIISSSSSSSIIIIIIIIGALKSQPGSGHWSRRRTANLRAEIMGLRGFDSSIILI